MSAVAIGQLGLRLGTTAPKPQRERNEREAPRARGASRVHRETYDIDSPEAQIHAPLSEDGTLESSYQVRKAALEMIHTAQSLSRQGPYSQGVISGAGARVGRVFFEHEHGLDHWSGTTDLSASQIAKLANCCARQVKRIKKDLAALGIISYRHRSMKTGLPDVPGAEPHIQISDIYWFDPANLAPWLKEIFDAILTRIKRAAAATAREKGIAQRKTPLKKRTREPCRSPSRLNPEGWVRIAAAMAKARLRAGAPRPLRDREAEAIAHAEQLARNGWNASTG